MIQRLFFYTTLVIVGLFVVQVKLNFQKKIQGKEYQYLYHSVEAKIRVNYVNRRILDKQIIQLRNDLGNWNSELNPYEK
jgi:cell division protein FtsB